MRLLLQSERTLAVQQIRDALGTPYDLSVRQSKDCTILLTDGLCDILLLSETFFIPLLQYNGKTEDFLSVCGAEIKIVTTEEETVFELLNGSMIVLTDTSVTAVQAQKYTKRSVATPLTEQSEHGTQEAFTDNLKDNTVLLRRRMRNENLRLEKMQVGAYNTPLCICSLQGITDTALVNRVRDRIRKARCSRPVGVGKLRETLEEKPFSLFSEVGVTERPDVAAGYLCEGRVVILTDGTPFAVFLPQIIADHIHTADDTQLKPIFKYTLRFLRIICAWIAVFLPGLYVGICLFHPEMLPSDILFDIVTALSATPMPLTGELLILQILYEIVREAGLRMPKAVGQTVGIIGALVIGDAAVSAGLVAAPTLIVVALAAVADAVLPGIHNPLALLRIVLILAGGLFGLYGIMLCTGVTAVCLCSVQIDRIPFTVPMTPLSIRKTKKKNISEYRF